LVLDIVATCHVDLGMFALVPSRIWKPLISRKLALSVEMFPTNLTKLTLIDSILLQDPIPVLERLQSLRIVQLWRNSYVGTEMICSTRGFPSLQKLQFIDLPNLSHIDIKDGAMPTLS
jgi:hypothetical protein